MITFEQLLCEVSIDQLRHDWVDSGKMDANLFDKLCQMAGNQSAYATWLVKRVGDNADWREKLMHTDINDAVITQWNEWFDIFTKYKQHFDKKDINQYKTDQDIADWIIKCTNVKQEVEEKKRLKDTDRFKIGAVQSGDKVYLVYKLPKGHEENRQTAIDLGKTDHEALGSRGWCTSSGRTDTYWKDHIRKEDLYIFINPRDRKFDKYQIQFGYGGDMPYWVGNDSPIRGAKLIPFIPFYDFLHEKENRPIPQEVESLRGYASLNSNVDDVKVGTVQVNDREYTAYELPRGHEENYRIAGELAGNMPWSYLLPLHSTDSWKRAINSTSYYIFISGDEKLLVGVDGHNQMTNIYTDTSWITNASLLKYKPFFDFIKERTDAQYPADLVRVLEVKRALENPEDNTMEIFRIGPGVYKVSRTDVRPENMRRWIKPIAIDLLHLRQDDMINASRFSVAYVRGEAIFFISADEDGGTVHMRAVVPGSKYSRRTETTTHYLEEGWQTIAGINSELTYRFHFTEQDGQNRALYERLKNLRDAFDAEYTFDKYLKGIFKDFIQADKVAERAAAREARQAERAAARDAARQARLDARANGQPVPSQEEPEILNRYRVTTEGTANFYSFPDVRATGVVQSLVNNADNAEAIVDRISGGRIGLVLQKDICLFVPALTSTFDDGYMPAITRVKRGSGEILAGDMNPDRLYEIYKKFKEEDDSVEYPPMIKKIANIKEGRLDRFAVDNIGQTSKLYMFSVDGAQRWIPYSFPSNWSRGTQHVFLGYISKWQFILTDTGKFMLTGRWGSGGSRSWIQSVPGLSSTLIAICDHYNIPRTGVLQQLQELCARNGVECPRVLREALSEDKFEKLLCETNNMLEEGLKFYQYKAMVRITYSKDPKFKAGAEKLAEILRAIPGATRVSTSSLDKEHGIAIFSVRVISQKSPRECFVAFKRNIKKKFGHIILKVEVGAGTIEQKGFIQ